MYTHVPTYYSSAATYGTTVANANQPQYQKGGYAELARSPGHLGAQTLQTPQYREWLRYRKMTKAFPKATLAPPWPPFVPPPNTHEREDTTVSEPMSPEMILASLAEDYDLSESAQKELLATLQPVPPKPPRKVITAGTSDWEKMAILVASQWFPPPRPGYEGVESGGALAVWRAKEIDTTELEAEIQMANIRARTFLTILEEHDMDKAMFRDRTVREQEDRTVQDWVKDVSTQGTGSIPSTNDLRGWY